MFGDVKVDDAAAVVVVVVGEHDEDEEDVQADGGDGEKIDRDQTADMVGDADPTHLEASPWAMSSSQSPAAVSVPRRRRWLERLARGARACLALRRGKPQLESTRLDGWPSTPPTNFATRVDWPNSGR